MAWHFERQQASAIARRGHDDRGDHDDKWSGGNGWESGSQTSGAWSSSSWTNLADPRELGKGKSKGKGHDKPKHKKGHGGKGSAAGSSAGASSGGKGSAAGASAGTSSDGKGGAAGSSAGASSDGQGGAAGSPVGTDPEPDAVWLKSEISFECSGCWKTGLKASELLLRFEYDWQGKITAVCLACSKLAPDIFKMRSGRMWAQRSANRKAVLRVDKFKEAYETLGRGEDETNREYKRRCFNAATKMIAQIFCAFKKADEAQKKEIVTAVDKWLEQQEAIAANPTHVPTLMSCGNLVAHSISEYAAEIMSGLCEYYLCRTVWVHGKKAFDENYNPCAGESRAQEHGLIDPLTARRGASTWPRCAPAFRQ